MISKRIGSICKVVIPIGIIIVALNLLSQSEASSQIQGWLSLVPPATAILLAWLWREVIVALFIGVWIGAWISHGLSPSGIVQGFFETTEVYILEAVLDRDHALMILFTFIIGGTISILVANGGVTGMVNLINTWANSPQRGQLAAAFLGLAIFFDDYANTLLVGTSMRPIIESLRISPQKLAYIIDTTAAPVATVALVSTWIGYQVDLIQESVDKLQGLNADAYAIFLQSIPYSFYSLLAIFFVLAVAGTKRDFGPMLVAESCARKIDSAPSSSGLKSLSSDLANFRAAKPNSEKPARAINAILPLSAMLVTTLIGLYLTGVAPAGAGASLQLIIGQADPYKSLLWGSQIGLFIAVSLSLGQRILSLQETLNAWLIGAKSMLQAIIVLLLAWSLAAVLKELGTSQFLIAILGERLIPELLPTIVFLLSALVAFASGSSWGTMAILLPVVIPLTWSVIINHDLSLNHIFYGSIASVLAGAVWGDHCSPLADTTILASIASRCNHFDHVQTQLPYALLVAAVAIVCGTIPAGFGIPWWFCLVIGSAVLLLILRHFGKYAA